LGKDLLGREDKPEKEEGEKRTKQEKTKNLGKEEKKRECLIKKRTLKRKGKRRSLY